MLKLDWNSLNNTIISGGEDCRYKVELSFFIENLSNFDLPFILHSMAEFSGHVHINTLNWKLSN